MLKFVAQAWRSLRSLEIQGGNRGRQPVRPIATLRGIAHLAELSPNLENLIVSIDASHDLHTEVNTALSARKKLDLAITTWLWSYDASMEQERIRGAISDIWKNRTWVNAYPPEKGRGTTFGLEGTLI